MTYEQDEGNLQRKPPKFQRVLFSLAVSFCASFHCLETSKASPCILWVSA